MSEIQRENLGYGAILLVSVLLLLWIIPVYSPEYPGYGVPATLVPNVAAGSIVLLAALGLARNFWAWRKTAGEKSPQKTEGAPSRVEWLHLVCFIGPCLLLMPAMAWAGFIPAGMAFMLLIQLFCGQRKVLPLLLVTIMPVGLVYVLMRFGLGIPMP